MLLLTHTQILIITLMSLASAVVTTHHKARHKHNLLNFRGNDINEIREAFDQYRSVIHKTKLHDKLESISSVYDEDSINEHDYDFKAVKKNMKFDARKSHVSSTGFKNYPAIDLGSNEMFVRNKRIHTSTRRTTTTVKSIDNYDEEYDDDDNDTTNRRLNDDAQASSLQHNNKYLSDSQNHQESEGESLTDFKMKTLGTMEDVRNSFQQEIIKQQRNKGQDVHHHIRQNILRLKIDGMCRWPNKKLIEMPQYAHKMYTPRKYVIYQCSDDTACCGSSDKTCVAKKTEEIVLWFHVRYVDSTGVEPLKIQNHTECECIYKNRPVNNRGTRIAYSWPLPTTSTTTQSPACRCPSHFEANIDDGNCGCICRDIKLECRQRYEGKEGFTISDQRCILNNECIQPHCLHGVYSTSNGRCPDKNDKINKGFQGTRFVREIF
ncbi:CLUMA_CG020880, isoform A [Clunio marinus]|uniref:CLUMA_CG020880, isoform A n=1 Tax=Clunio marinus TaxID=568069 RepID=A0A1J1J905_9DIPT|nr:CLUMA_CG020880, isoform A [Clunio marinus]